MRRFGRMEHYDWLAGGRGTGCSLRQPRASLIHQIIRRFGSVPNGLLALAQTQLCMILNGWRASNLAQMVRRNYAAEQEAVHKSTYARLVRMYFCCRKHDCFLPQTELSVLQVTIFVTLTKVGVHSRIFLVRRQLWWMLLAVWSHHT